MSAKELILDGGGTLDGVARKLRLNNTPDGKCVTIRTPNNGIVAVLDRDQQYLLMLYLQERLDR